MALLSDLRSAGAWPRRGQCIDAGRSAVQLPWAGVSTITGIVRSVFFWYSASCGERSASALKRRSRSSCALAGDNVDRVGMGFEVVVPVRIGWGSALGGEDDVAPAIAPVGERVDAAPPGLRAGVV
jgi:hypothetical protein